MSRQPPATSAQRLVARQTGVVPVARQLAVLALGMASAAVIARTLSRITAQSAPLWVLAVIVSGVAFFSGLLLVAHWSMRSAVGNSPRPVVTGGVYLTASLLAAALLAYGSGIPPACYLAPLAAAGASAALTLAAARRRRSNAGRINALRRGAHVRGIVTDDGLAGFATTPEPKLATITVAFRDTDDVERWVTATAIQAPVQPIAAGDQVDVWFDAQTPGDTSRILVQHDNGASRIVAVGVSRR